MVGENENNLQVKKPKFNGSFGTSKKSNKVSKLKFVFKTHKVFALSFVINFHILFL